MQNNKKSMNFIKKMENTKMLWVAAGLSVMQSFLSVFLAFLLEELVNTAVSADAQRLWKLFAMIGIYVVLSVLVIWLASAVSNRYVAEQNAKLRTFLLDRLLKKPVGDYQKLGMGKVLAMLENDISLIEKHYYRARLSLISLMSTFLFGFISMFVINWKIALVVIVTSLIPVVFSSVYSKPLQTLQGAFSNSYGQYMTSLKNALSNYSLIKVFHIEDKVQSDVSEQCSRQETCKKHYQVRADRCEGYTSLMSFAVIIGVFGVGTLLIMNGSVQIGALLAFVQLTNYVLSPIEGISIQAGHIRSCQPIVQSFEDFVHMHNKQNGTEFPKQPVIVLENVSYYYGEKKALDGIDLRFEPGKKYVVIGSNGSGKSTLLHIINRFYEDYGGNVYFGNTEARKIDPTSFYHNTIMLQQDVLILKDTVRNNILLYDSSTDLYALDTAIETLQLRELTDGDAVCLDNGDNLSGGEKQRIAAARALIRRPYILLLDESFSALDPSSREIVEKALLHSAQIVIAISHDRSVENLQKYDEIIYLSDGKVLAKGTPKELSGILTLSN